MKPDETFITHLHCNVCKTDFGMMMNDHLDGYGCPKCDKKSGKEVRALVIAKFEEEKPVYWPLGEWK